MPPDDDNPSPDSALGLMNIHQAAGLGDRARKRVWETTRQAIERQGLELQGEIAVGATAVVFDARENIGRRLLGRRLVVKVIVEPENARALACFRREVKFLASEDVPTDVVPNLKHYQEVDNPAAPTIQPFLVTERIDGQRILDYIRHPSPMPVAERIELIERAFLALERLHSGHILHGDISQNNVMVQKGGVIRLIDLGLAKPLHRVGTQSLSMGGGTPGPQAITILTGENRLAVWADVHALASVAFHVLTDRPPGKKPGDVDANAEALRAAGVPIAVARVLLKALREKDPRQEIDRSLYASAAEVARSLRSCRERQVRRAVRKRHAVVASLVAGPMLAVALGVAGLGWSRYWTDKNRQIVALREEAAGLSQERHPRVEALAARADQLIRERKALAWWQINRADDLASKLLDTLRQDIALRRGLERCLELREALASVLASTPWNQEFEAIDRAHAALVERDIAIAAMIERGETDAAWVALGSLNAALGKLASNNRDALSVAEPRARFRQARDGLPERLQKLKATDPAYAGVNQSADDAEKAWKAGAWVNASRHFGLAQKALDGWLDGKETPEELAARRAADRESDLVIARRELAFRKEIDRLEKLKIKHTEQITELNAQNLSDREAYAIALRELQAERKRLADAETRANTLSATLSQGRKELQTERDRRAAAETTANERSVTLNQERKAAGQNLATERSAKESALQGKKTAESELAQARLRVVDLEKSVGDLRKNLVAPSVPSQQFINSESMTMVRIERGEFLMGATKEQIDMLVNQFPGTDRAWFKGEQPQHPVKITRSFYLAAHPVTVKQFRRFVKSDGYKTEAEQAGGGNNWRAPGFAQGDDHPVVYVSHNDAMAYIRWLNAQKTEKNRGYRLPTEAEREYASRAGTRGLYGGDDDPKKLVCIANLDGDADGFKYTAPVGSFAPNPWHLYDMIGNVWEWCDDWYEDTFYQSSPEEDPRNTARASYRVIRGGGWSLDPRSCRPAYRHWSAPVYRNGSLGFRLAAVQE
jgi:sulfatase modifying factor 1